MEETHRKKRSAAGTALRFLIPLAVTVGLCWHMFRSIDMGEMMRIIRHECDFRWILAGLLLNAGAMYARAMRWRIQLKALGYDVPRYTLVLSIFGTYAVNLVFPRLGEFWRSGFIAQRQKAPFSTVFGSMVAERLSDTVVVALFMLAAFLASSSSLLAYLHQNDETFHGLTAVVESPWTWLAIALLGAAAVLLLTRKTGADSWLGKIQGFVKGLWQGFAVIATMKGKGRWLLYTLMMWMCYFAQLWLVFLAFPFAREVLAQYGFTALLVTYAISSVAMGVPSNGGIGPYQFAIIFALGLYGVDTTMAAALGNMALGSQTLFVIVLGIYTFIAIMLQKRKERSRD